MEISLDSNQTFASTHTNKHGWSHTFTFILETQAREFHFNLLWVLRCVERWDEYPWWWGCGYWMRWGWNWWLFWLKLSSRIECECEKIKRNERMNEWMNAKVRPKTKESETTLRNFATVSYNICLTWSSTSSLPFYQSTHSIQAKSFLIVRGFIIVTLKSYQATKREWDIVFLFECEFGVGVGNRMRTPSMWNC